MKVVIVTYKIFRAVERPEFVLELESKLAELGLQRSLVKKDSFTISTSKFKNLLYSFNSHMAKIKWHDLDELAVYYPHFQEIGAEAVPSLGKYDLKIRGYSIGNPQVN